MANVVSSTPTSDSQNHNSGAYVSLSLTLPLKLDRTNFLLWKSQVLPLIRGNGLDHFIARPAPMPDQFVESVGSSSSSRIENPEYLRWRKQDQLLLGWLMTTISEGILHLVLNYETSFDLWISLDRHFGSQSRARVLQLHMQLNSVNKDAMSIMEYYTKMRAIDDNLASAGSGITEDDFLMHFLGGLGPEFDSVVVMVTGRNDSIDSNSALFHLLTYECLIEQQNMSHSVDTRGNFSANYAQATNNQRKGKAISYGYNPGGGYGRGKSQQSHHGNNHNYHRNDQGVFTDSHKDSQNYKGNTKAICQICLKPGHIANMCYHRFKNNYVPTQRPQNYHASSSGNANANWQVNKSAFIANSGIAADEGWYIDSGATHHLTNDPARMNNITEYRGQAEGNSAAGGSCCERAIQDSD